MATSPAMEQPVKPGKTWFQKRLDKMTRIYRQLERENVELRQRLSDAEELMARWKDVALRYQRVLKKRGQHGE